jgi:hypothetical protein
MECVRLAAAFDRAFSLRQREQAPALHARRETRQALVCTCEMLNRTRNRNAELFWFIFASFGEHQRLGLVCGRVNPV